MDKKIISISILALLLVGCGKKVETTVNNNSTNEIETALNNSSKNINNTKEKEENTSTVPNEYIAALKKAQIYSDSMYMSKASLYNQLTSEHGEKFPPEAAQYAIDNISVDWKLNALEKAKIYQKDMSMSREAIRDQLLSENGENFTKEETDWAIENLEQ